MSSGSRQGGKKDTFDVFVGNLPGDADEQYLRTLFNKFGAIDSAFVSRKDENKVYGFVKFLSEADAEAAGRQKNITVDGKQLNVRYSKGRGDRSTSGVGGGTFMKNKGQDQQKFAYGNKPDLVSNHGSGDKQHKQQRPQLSKSSKPALPDLLREEMVLVTHVEGPLMFYAQSLTPDAIDNLQQVTKSLPEFCVSAHPVSEKALHNKVYAAQFSEDEQWYRCKLDKALEGNRVKIIFIDYGNGEEKNLSDLVELPPFLANAPAMASKYVLYGLKPVHEEGTMGYEQGVAHLQQITIGSPFNAKIYNEHIAKGNFLPVILENEDIDVNQEMLNRQFGKKRFYSGAKGPTPATQQQGKKPTASPPQPLMQAGPDWQQTPEQMGVFDQGGIGTWVNQTPVLSPPRPMPNIGRKAVAFKQEVEMPPPVTFIQSQDLGVEKGEVTSRIMELTSRMELMRDQLITENQSLQKQKDEIMGKNVKLEKQRDQAFLEVSTTKGQLKKLQENHSALTVKLGEANVSFKVKHLVTGVNKVKHLRRQFPTDGQTPDIIETAITMALDPDKVTTTGLDIISKVETSLDGYKRAQEEIKASQDLDSAMSLLEVRDSLRKELVSNIKEFLAAMEVLPLAKRCVDLRDVIHSMEATHAIFMRSEILNVIPVNELAALYPNWKDQKACLFQDVRTTTNTRHNEVDHALRQIQQQFSLALSSGSDSPGPKTDLDILLNKFNEAINRETEKTDMSLTQDSTFLNLVVKTLLQELNAELNNIDRLQTLQGEYAEMIVQLSPWLESKPDLSELQAVRKTIKSLKSKLRHKLADKVDLEETDETVNGDLAHVEKELCEIRKKLQSAFIREDQHLAEIAELQSKHFPELQLQYSDIGLQIVWEYDGLVKSGRSLEQFDIKPLVESKSSILQSTFCGHPIVLKEYLVDDTIGVKKSDFLKHAMSYNKLITTNLVPIEGVFFMKGERQVYVQVPFYEKGLAKAQESDITEEGQFLAFYGIVKGLQMLHRAKLVHGNIHPNNIFLNEKNQGVLEEINFVRPMKGRVEKPFACSRGLCFISPEAISQHEVTMASDVFVLGLIALWLNFPDKEFQVQSNGVPDLNGLEMSRNLGELLERLLNPDPSQRPSAHELLRMSYFSFSPFLRAVSPTMAQKEVTLQLRPKSTPEGRPGSPSTVKLPGGILKNGSSACEGSSSPTLKTPVPDIVGTSQTELYSSNAQSKVQELDPLMILDSAGSAELVSADCSLIDIQVEAETEEESDDVLHESSLIQDIAGSPAVPSLVNEIRPSASELTPPTLDTPMNTPVEPADITSSSSLDKTVLQQAALLAALEEEHLEETDVQNGGEDYIENEEVENSVNTGPQKDSTEDREGCQIDPEVRDSLLSTLSSLPSHITIEDIKGLLGEACLTRAQAFTKGDMNNTCEQETDTDLPTDVDLPSSEDEDLPPGLEENSS